MATEQFRNYNEMLELYGDDPRTVAVIREVEGSDFSPKDFIPAYEPIPAQTSYDWAMDEYGDPRLVSTAVEIATREAHPERFMNRYAGKGPKEGTMPRGIEIPVSPSSVDHTRK